MKKRFISAFLACVMATGTFGGISALGEEKEMNVSSVLTENIVYVSQEGKSGATGSKSDPFRAIYEAQEYLREKELSEENRGIIYLREGTYNVTESIEITEADSYITLSAYADERVEITGSAELENAKFKKLSEAEGGQFSSKARLQSGVKDKIYVYDMGSEGMSVGEIYKNGFNWKKLPLAPELVVDEKMQTLARYPNEDNIFLTNAEMGKVSGGTNVRNYFFDKTDEPKTYEEMLGMDGPILSIKALPDRAKKWAAPYGNETYSAVSGLQPEINVNSDNTLYETDGWIRGRVGNDYSDDNLKMYSVKNDSGTYKIYFKYPSLYGVMNGFKVQAINLLCELDTPGEYYIDRFGGNNVLYYYPEDGEIDGKSIKITALDKNLVYMNGAKGVRLNNIIFTGTTNSGIQMTDCEDCVVSDCEFYNILMDAIRIGANNDAITCDPSYETWGGGHDNLVTNCSIHDMGHGGVYVSGGDCKSLERGDNIVENCEIYNFSRLATYTPGIYLEGVGHTARNNYLHDAPHMMLQIMGNDMLVTHNRFVNSAYNSNDQTPIYIGRNWMWMGNEICYNYIDNVHWENSTNFNFGIYMDDNTAGVMIHHNLFHQVGGNAFYSNTGYLMYVTDNIVVETTGPYFRFRTEGDAKWARPIVNEKPLKYRFFDIMRTREEAIASGDEDNEYTKGYWNTQENIDKYIKHYNELYNNLPEFSKKEKYAFDLSKKYFPAEGDASARVWTDRNNVMTIADVTIVRNITVDSGDLWNLGGFYNNDISAVTDPDTFDIKRHRADSTDDLGLDLETGKIDKGSSLLYDENFGEEWVKEWNESFTAAEAGLLPKVKKHRLWNKIGEAEAIENKSGGLKSAIEKAHAAATCYEATQADIDNSTALLMNELEEYAPQYDLSEYSLNMEIGDRAILSVINLKEGDKVLWSSSNEAVAGVEEGVVTALSGGTSQISAKIGETEVSCTVTVKDLVLTISRENAVLNLSDVTSVNLKATGVPEGVEVCWTTSDEAVARVENGTITATGAGEAVITAETCGKELYCNVRVLDIEISDDELAMHFKADEGTVTDEDDNLSKWENLAPSGGSALQSTQGKQPKLIEDISGRKYLQFDGTDDYLQMTTSYNFKGRNEATIIVVSESEEGTITKDNGDYYCLFTVCNNGNWGQMTFTPSYNNAQAMFGGGTSAASGSVETKRVQKEGLLVSAARKDGGSVGIYENGEWTLFEKSNTPLTNTGTTVRIGGKRSGNNGAEAPSGGNVFYKGKIAEILVYGRALSDDEMSLVNEMLNQKYAYKEIDGAEAVVRDAESIDFGQRLDAVRGSLKLPDVGVLGSRITWESSNEDVITLKGRVIRPKIGEEDAYVTLTATFEKDGYVNVVTYNVTVKAKVEKYTSGASFAYNEFEAFSTVKYINFDLLVNTTSDGTIGFCSSSNIPSAWGHYNISLGIRPDGHLDAHNGSGYTYTDYVTYEENKLYHAVVKVDCASNKFSFYIIDEEGNLSTVAKDFAFRNKCTDINKFTVRGGNNVKGGLFEISSFYVTDSPFCVTKGDVVDGSVTYSVINLDSDKWVDMYVAELDAENNVLSSKKQAKLIQKEGKAAFEEYAVSPECSYIKLFTWSEDGVVPLVNKVKKTVNKFE